MPLTQTELEEGDSGTEDLIFELDRYGGYTARVIPNQGDILFVKDIPETERRVSLTDFTQWTVTVARKDFVELELDNDVVFQVFSAGITRFKNMTTEATFEYGNPDIDVDTKRTKKELNDDNWWFYSTDIWDITSNDLTVQSEATSALFFHNRDQEDWLATISGFEDEDLKIGNTNNEKLARAIRMGFWAVIEENISDLRRDKYVATAERSALNAHGRMMNVTRNIDESDESYRLRIFGEYKRRIGGVTRDDVINFVENATQGETGEVEIVNENQDPDTGEFKPGYFEVNVSTSALRRAGFDSTQFNDILGKVETILQRISSAGSQPVVNLLTGSEWDTDDWDDSTYGT